MCCLCAAAVGTEKQICTAPSQTKGWRVDLIHSATWEGRTVSTAQHQRREAAYSPVWSTVAWRIRKWNIRAPSFHSTAETFNNPDSVCLRRTAQTPCKEMTYCLCDSCVSTGQVWRPLCVCIKHQQCYRKRCVFLSALRSDVCKWTENQVLTTGMKV